MAHKEQILSAVELRQHKPVAIPKQNGVSEKSDVMSHQQTLDSLRFGLVGKTRSEIPQQMGMQVSGKISAAASESKCFKLQRSSSQQAVAPVQASSDKKYFDKVPFSELYPYILPQLDTDKRMQLQSLYTKLQKNEITRVDFLRMMGGIVGSKMLLLAAEKRKAQPVPVVQKTESRHQTPAPNQQNGQVTGVSSEIQTTIQAPQNRNAEETKPGPSLSVPVHPSAERNHSPIKVVGHLVINQLSSQIHTTPAAMNGSAFSAKPHLGQKKPLENSDSSLQPLSKKPKISRPNEDQSIEQINDVAAICGVNLQEEEGKLLSEPEEEARVSDASLRAVREEETKMILEKVPLQKKLSEIMAKCGMKNASKDVERCLSLSVEERIRGFLCNLIRISKQRIDVEKQNHKTTITSDIHQQLMILNRRAKEELEKKEAETEKQMKTSEPDGGNAPESKEKDEGRGKSRKVNKPEDDKMRTTAANVAARAAVGGDDLLLKWQLMAEQAQQRREGIVQAGSKPSSMFGGSVDSRGSGRGLVSPLIASARKLGRNQATAPQQGVARSISMNDVISVLGRETQMAKSALIYNLYNRVPPNPARNDA